MHASASSHMADRAILDSSHRDGKIDPEELGNVFQLLRHKTKKVSGFLRRRKVQVWRRFPFLLSKYSRISKTWFGRWMMIATSAWTGQSSRRCIIAVEMTRLVGLTVTSILQSVRVKQTTSAFLITFNCSAGYEPRRLFNVVEFLMNDKDDNGSVSVEEAMQILYLRHGRSLLDTVRDIFAFNRAPRRVTHEN